MKRLLTSQDTETFNRECAHNPVYQVICKAFRQIGWKRLCFTNEEICLGCFTTLDQIILDKERAEDILEGLQQQMYREIKEQAHLSQREFCPQEAEWAVRCVKLALLVCLEEWGEDGLPQCLLDKMALSVLREDPDFVRPLMGMLVRAHRGHQDSFCTFVRTYARERNFLSLHYQEGKKQSQPVPTVLRAAQWQDEMARVRRFLEFMKGSCPTNPQESCMSAAHFCQMMQALEHLVRYGQVMPLEQKLNTALPVNWLRYTFYLLSRDVVTQIPKVQWIDFLVQTFQQMERGRDSHANHFSEKPRDYDKIMRRGRRA